MKGDSGVVHLLLDEEVLMRDSLVEVIPDLRFELRNDIRRQLHVEHLPTAHRRDSFYTKRSWFLLARRFYFFRQAHQFLGGFLIMCDDDGFSVCFCTASLYLDEAGFLVLGVQFLSSLLLIINVLRLLGLPFLEPGVLLIYFSCCH